MGNGGERGIRTLDTASAVYLISSQAPSTTRPSLREPRIISRWRGAANTRADRRRADARCRQRKKNRGRGPRPTPSQPDAAISSRAPPLFAGARRGSRCRRAICGAGTALPWAFMLGEIVRGDAILGLGLLLFCQVGRGGGLGFRLGAFCASVIGGAGGSFATATPNDATTNAAASSARIVFIVALPPPIARCGRCTPPSRGALRPAAARPVACGLPAFTSLYQYSWCSFAHVSST